jgi:hypothetical protein
MYLSISSPDFEELTNGIIVIQKGCFRFFSLESEKE